MKIEEIRVGLVDSLQSLLAAQSFAFRKATDVEFARKGTQVSHLFRVYVKPWSGWIGVETAAFVGCPTITKLFNEILGRKVSNNAPACGFGVQNQFPERGSYQVNVADDLPTVVDKVRRDFEEVAVPFFERIGGIDAIDRELNAPDPAGRFKVHPVDRACIGLITAKLSGNPAFSQLAESYFKSCRESQGPALAQPLLKVRDYFERQGNAALQLPT